MLYFYIAKSAPFILRITSMTKQSQNLTYWTTLCLTAFLAIYTSSCDERTQNPLTSPEIFSEVYLTLLVSATEDSLTQVVADSIILACGYNSNQYEDAKQYFNGRAELWQDVLKEVVLRLNERLAQADSSVNHEK